MTDDELDQFLDRRRDILRERITWLLAEVDRIRQELAAIEPGVAAGAATLRQVDGGRS